MANPGQLRRTPGLLGYSLLARILKRQFWTLSMWEGEAALQQFVMENPHSQVMMAFRDKMDQTRPEASPKVWNLQKNRR
jgi:heme-degrading monooxygenase HmoA